MTVQARFFVSEITKGAAGNGTRIKLSPVTRGKHNADWAAATPVATFEMSVNNPAAAAWFDERIGKELAITFEDRPELCEHCHEEISYTRPAGNYGEVGTVHVACHPLAAAAKG